VSTGGCAGSTVAAGVLDLARDERAPVLERVRLSAIFAGLVDEFFAISAATLTRQAATGMSVRAGDRSPSDQLSELSAWVHELVATHDPARCTTISCRRWRTTVSPSCAGTQTTEAERTELDLVFRRWIEPVLTPLTMDATHPFPYVSALSLNIAVLLRNPVFGAGAVRTVDGCRHWSRICSRSDRTVSYPCTTLSVATSVSYFAGSQIAAAHAFRVTRSRVVDRKHNTAEPNTAMTHDLRPRRFGTPVRLEVEQTMNAVTLALLLRELGLHETDVLPTAEPAVDGQLPRTDPRLGRAGPRRRWSRRHEAASRRRPRRRQFSWNREWIALLPLDLIQQMPLLLGLRVSTQQARAVS